MMIVDTSAWVDFFRGTEPMATAVDDALTSNEVALCGPIETELRRGLRDPRERKQVLPLFEGCHWSDTPANLWVEAGELGYALRRRGGGRQDVRSIDSNLRAHLQRCPTHFRC